MEPASILAARSSEAFDLREMSAEDAAPVARLSEELGYLARPDVMQRRIESLRGSTNRAAYVVCHGGDVVGWIDLMATNHLLSEPRVEISGLVVASNFRGRGIGRLLVACAERWAVERGMKMILVRSREAREAAHRFYLREGFVRTKTSAVFSKNLA
jgi:GNAT superfamily N-acetyltransferase